uniref:PREDICTED: isoflavone synthase n=1 Tax=Lupinus angustifolius TaxID=3871 RepID=A0A2K4N7V0_LUPAN|nr:PREDICTED: isoflavone synthase [Lupinus angustifolius]
MLQELIIPFLLLALYIHFHPSPSKSKSKHSFPYPPSPKLRLPFVGHLHLLKLPLHHSLISLSKQYGPLYSLYFGSMPTIVVSTPQLFKLFLQTHEASSFNTRFQTSAIKRLTYGNSVAMVPFGPYWKFIRKLIMNELLNATTVNKLRPLRSREIHRVLKVLANNSETRGVVNVTEELLKWTNNTISMMMLGEAELVKDIAREVLKIFGEYSLSDFIWPLKKLKVGEYEKRIENIFNKFDPIIEKVTNKRQDIRERRKNGEVIEGESVVFLDTLLEFAEDPNMEIKISRDQIKGLVVDFFSAGTDSTAVATEWALAELINNPKVLKKAQEELNEVVEKDRLADELDIPNLPYIRAIVKETFRLHPPLPVVKRKCVQECVIDNYTIPEGALILFNVWAVGRDPKYWDNPSEFRPERFLENVEGEQGIDVKGQHFQLLPFGSGRRMCPGVSLATSGISTLLATLIQCFELKPVDLQGHILNGDDAIVSMEERPGLSVPRAHNLMCVPFARVGSPVKLIT